MTPLEPPLRLRRPARRQQPPELLVGALAQARAAGLGFDAAWPTAVGRAMRHVPGRDWAAWSDALAATREGWGRAFEREPATDAEAAAGLLAVS